MLTNQVYGVDLGSSMIKIYSQRSDEIIKERNMIAVRNRDQILAVGDEAYEMYEKNPDNVEVSSTMSGGMIADINNLEAVLQILLEKAGRPGRHPVIYFAVPVDMTEIEKRAYYAVAKAGRFRQSRVLLVEKPIVDALALGIPIIKTRGSMIINMGADTTEVSVIADSRVIISRILPWGGDTFTADIQNNIRRKNNLSVGLRTAGRLKLSLADLHPDPELKQARKIFGMDDVAGLPRERVVTAAVINDSIRSSLEQIAQEIQNFLERIPPQIRRAILEEGIYLTGGSSRIPYIDKLLSENLGCPILLSKYYELCTVYGLKEIITHDALHHWAFTPKQRKKERL